MFIIHVLHSLENSVLDRQTTKPTRVELIQLNYTLAGPVSTVLLVNGELTPDTKKAAPKNRGGLELNQLRTTRRSSSVSCSGSDDAASGAPSPRSGGSFPGSPRSPVPPPPGCGRSSHRSRTASGALFPPGE